jgi:hypothetical protein
LHEHQAALGVAGGAVLVGIVLLGASYRHLRRRQLRSRLLALPASERSDLLRSLDAGEPNIFRLMAPIIHEFEAPTEVSPAAPAPGRGDEASPAP